MSTSSRPLDDDEVKQELAKMVAFIKQEAAEKAREIRVKADEEFAIEKAKIVRQESINIEAAFEKRKKQAIVAQKIAQSTQTNKARLKVLAAREERLADLFDAARKGVANLSSKSADYGGLLENLILQCLLQLMEPTAVVEVRKKDASVARGAADKAAARYKDLSGREVKIDVQAEGGDEGNGGVVLRALGGRVTINNTLDERLSLLEEKSLPEIRHDLFGPNPARKFYN